MTTAMTPTFEATRTFAQRQPPRSSRWTPLGATLTWWRQVTIDLVLVIVIAGVVGGVGSVLAGPLGAVAFAGGRSGRIPRSPADDQPPSVK